MDNLRLAAQGPLARAAAAGNGRLGVGLCDPDPPWPFLRAPVEDWSRFSVMQSALWKKYLRYAHFFTNSLMLLWI